MKRRPSPHALAATALLMCLGATSLHARTAVVATDGSGNYTTIQGAIDGLFATRSLGSPDVPPDTVRVLAGTYDETIQTHVDENFTVLRIVCPAGPAATRVRAVSYPALHYQEQHPADIEGLGVIQQVQAGAFAGVYWFRGCRFEAGYTMELDELDTVPAAFLQDCTFLGRSRLTPNGGALTGLHFIGAPVAITAKGGGGFVMYQCTFEGPADTLVTAQPRYNFWGIFNQCRFSGANVGIAKGVVGGVETFDQIHVYSSTFENLAQAAIATNLRSLGIRRFPGFRMQNSRVTNCGRAVDWRGAGFAVMVDDTLQTTAAPAVVVQGPQVEMQNVLTAPGTGGVQVRLEGGVSSGGFESLGTLLIQRCRFDHPAGTAIEVVDTVISTPVSTVIRANSITGATGLGIRVSSLLASIRRNVVSSCGGDGIRCEMLGDSPSFFVDSNTVVRSHGDGLRTVNSVGIGTPQRFVTQNMLVLNDGVGLNLGTPIAGSVAGNNAWQNSTGDFAGVANPLASNLSIDPQFCDLAGGDFHLLRHSACGPGGAYGQIGALGEACTITVGVPGGSGTTSFALAPNPARGRVSFTPPAAGADGTIEVLDLQGRRVWSRAFRAGGAPIEWRGESPNGRVDAGLYWVRVARPEGAQTRRLVWLR